MYLIQGSRKFDSLDTARENLLINGRRLAIIGDERAATVRPQIVMTFPGTIQDLFDLALKLGGYPVDVFMKDKQHFEKQDGLKELVFAKVLAYLDWLWGQKQESITNDLISYLKRITMQSNLIDEVYQFSSVQELLESFRTNIYKDDEFQIVPAAEAMHQKVEQQIVAQVGLELSKHLIKNMLDELKVWLEDPYSPYFNVSLNYDELPFMQCYLLMLKHPDVAKIHKGFVFSLTDQILKTNPALLFHDSHKADFVKIRNNSDNPFTLSNNDDDEPKTLLETLSNQQKDLLLKLYLAKGSPLELIRDAMQHISFTEHVIAEHEEELDDELLEYMTFFLNDLDLNDLQDIENIISDHPVFAPEIVHAMLSKYFNEEIDLSEDEEDDEELDEEEDFDEGYEQFKHQYRNDAVFRDLVDKRIRNMHFDIVKREFIDNDDLSWQEKGILAFAYFVCSGIVAIEVLQEVSKNSAKSTKKVMNQLVDKGYVYNIFDEDHYQIILEDLDEVFDSDSDDFNEFVDHLTDQNLSWEAKGIYTYYMIEKIMVEEDMIDFSSDQKNKIRKAYKELVESGYLKAMDEAKYFVEFPSEEEIERKLKDKIIAWYNDNLKESIQVMLQEPKKVDMLSATYPSMDNMSALQISVIANDAQAVASLMSIKQLQYPKEMSFDKLGQTHPLVLALRFRNFDLLPLIVDKIESGGKGELVEQALYTIFRSNDVSLVILNAALHLVESLNQKQDILNGLLVQSVLTRKIYITEMLLNAGASPSEAMFQGKTLVEFVEEEEYEEFLELFECGDWTNE